MEIWTVGGIGISVVNCINQWKSGSITKNKVLCIYEDGICWGGLAKASWNKEGSSREKEQHKVLEVVEMWKQLGLICGIYLPDHKETNTVKMVLVLSVKRQYIWKKNL